MDRVLNADSPADRSEPRRVNTYNITPSVSDDILYRTDNKEEYDLKKLTMQQDAFLARQWKTSSHNISAKQQLNGLTLLNLMYRDADLMDTFPEIGAALTLYSDEATTLDQQGKMFNITSSSPRVKAILEDLFVKRLNLNVWAPRIIRNMCKYGNTYMLMKMQSNRGVEAWREMPVYEMQRNEDGVSPYWYSNDNAKNDKSTKVPSTTFVWMGNTDGQTPASEFKDWQIAHFRILTDSVFLPYGQSILNCARRHFRMLYMMEDSMLIYRLDRSIERRVFKVYVGGIDDKDVPAYVDQVINQTKRGSIIDPQTGQIDIRKNWASVVDDYYIPVRDMNAPNPIETLQGAQNLTAIDDIKFMQNKVFTALRVPRAFLSFDESTGEGKNLAMMDVRFARAVNRIQLAFIEELTRVAIIHLILLGLKDELTNFSISMNNPSSQADTLACELMQKKLSLVRDAVQDNGNGIQTLSLQRALKMFLNFSEEDIKENFNEIRLEKALAEELNKTPEIIKRTHIFDPVDRLYGEPGAEYSSAGGEDGDGGPGGAPGGGGGGFGGGGDFGGGLDAISGDEGAGEVTGEEGEAPMGEVTPAGMAPEAPAPGNPGETTAPEPPVNPNEGKKPKGNGKLLTEDKVLLDTKNLMQNAFTEMISEIDKQIES